MQGAAFAPRTLGNFRLGNITEPCRNATVVRGHTERRTCLPENNAAIGGIRRHAGACVADVNVAAA
jgi:hypothetical protein